MEGWRSQSQCDGNWLRHRAESDRGDNQLEDGRCAGFDGEKREECKVADKEVAMLRLRNARTGWYGVKIEGSKTEVECELYSVSHPCSTFQLQDTEKREGSSRWMD